VVIDCETGGFFSQTDALLEIAGVEIIMDAKGRLARGESWRYHVRPFDGARLDPKSLAVNGIDPHHPLRPALSEEEALGRLFKEIRTRIKARGCTRAILVGHNAPFDLGFLNAAVERNNIKRNPFHPFSTFDTVTLAGVAVGQTVLSKAAQAIGLSWDHASAHSARYDAEMTADLFCVLSNRFQALFESALPVPTTNDDRLLEPAGIEPE